MIPFYYIDGTQKGKTIHSDFKPTETTAGETYHKHTFVVRIQGGLFYIDIASLDRSPKELDITEDMCFHFRGELKAERHE